MGVNACSRASLSITNAGVHTMSNAVQLHSNTDAADRYKHGDIARAHCYAANQNYHRAVVQISPN
jgi:hypothetical protein